MRTIRVAPDSSRISALLANPARRDGMPGVLVCAHCGAVRSHDQASNPGFGILSRLARVGLGVNARRLLGGDQGDG